MPLGYQAVQSAHALREFTERFPRQNQEWYENNNSIIIVSCSDYVEFKKCLLKAQQQGIEFAEFKEPDIAYQVTAAAFVPSEATKKLLKHCRLLGKANETENLLSYVYKMKKTPQGPIAVWEHGKSVEGKFLQLLSGEYKSWPRIEKIVWLAKAIEEFSYNINDVRTYCLFHDIGKADCIVEENGVFRFPNHAQVSHDLWMRLDGREHIACWMRNDMAIHTMCKEEFLTIHDKELHRLVGLAELYANAILFDCDSDSFKMKFEKIKRNGNF